MTQPVSRLRLAFLGLTVAPILFVILGLLSHFDVLPAAAGPLLAVLLAADGLLLALTLPSLLRISYSAAPDSLLHRSTPWRLATYFAIVSGVLLLTYSLEGYFIPHLPFTPAPASIIGMLLMLAGVVAMVSRGSPGS